MVKEMCILHWKVYLFYIVLGGDGSSVVRILTVISFTKWNI